MSIIDRIEPDAAQSLRDTVKDLDCVPSDVTIAAATVSIAISLKRIADSLHNDEIYRRLYNAIDNASTMHAQRMRGN